LPPEAVTVDARGLKCPLPVLKAEKALEGLPPGAELVVLATDPMAKVDIPLYCRQKGHACTVGTDAGVLRFTIVKAG
jgi:tRNA 2-thiouridine synthesizing protein A